MAGAVPSAPVAADDLERPRPIKAIPVRHWGRWVSAAILLFFAVALGWSLAHNPNVGYATIGEYLFKDLVLRGVLMTLEMTAIAMVIGIVGGTVVAVMRLSDNPILRTVSWLYIWLFRGVPLLVQMIFWGFLGALYFNLYLGIPFAGVVFAHGNTSAIIGAFTAGILALGLSEVAYAAELVRAGIISVDEGQNEAALSLGMSAGLTMRRVVLPQAMRVIIPPMGNETITMLKMTSLVSVISGSELLTTVQQVYAQNFKQIPLLIVASLWYLALVTLLTIGQHYLEKRYGRGFGQADAGRADRKALKREVRNA
jgi:polar amino acid transport system permease protein